MNTETTPEKLANIIRKEILDKEDGIDRVSDMLSDITNKQFTVWFGDYRMIVNPQDGGIRSCVEFERVSINKIWTAQNEKTHKDPIEFLSGAEKKKLAEKIKKAGLKCKIEAKQYYVVTINGCRVTNSFNRGPVPDKNGNDVVFPPELSTNLFDDAETCQEVKDRFIRYHAAFLRWRVSKGFVAKR
jgi:hypothetical protein